MHDVLARLNLNALVALDLLLEERHVTRAASRAGVSQSAMSHQLAQLRAQLDDPLLVRVGSGLVPTPFAEALTPRLRRALVDLEEAVRRPAVLDPATLRRAFVVATTDAFVPTFLDRLVARLSREAPGVDLSVVPYDQARVEPLAHGEVDLVFAPLFDALVGCRSVRVFDESFAVLVRQGHPDVDGAIDLDTYVRLPHVLFSPQGEGPGIVDRVLADRGLSRRVAVRLRYLLAAPALVAASDLVCTLPASAAARLAEHAPLQVLPPPLPLPGFAMHLVWHERVHADPAHAWFRDRVRASCVPDVRTAGSTR